MISLVNFFHTGPEITKDLNLVELFKPLYILLSLLGLFLYRIRFPTKSDPTVTPVSLVAHLICAIVMTLSLCAIFGTSIYFTALNSLKWSIFIINYLIEMLMLQASGVFAYLCAFKSKKTYVSILTDVSLVWSELSNANVLSILKQFRVYIKFLVFAWMPMLITASFLAIGTSDRNLRTIVSTIVPEIVSTAVVGFYYILVLMVISLLKIIELHCNQLIEDRQVNQMHDDALSTLGQMELAYMKALRIKEDINSAFSAPILLILVQVFHSTLRQAHVLYHGGMIDHVFDMRDIAVRLMYMLHSLCKLYAITFTGTMLKKEAFQIGKILHKVPIKIQDTPLYMKVQHFSTMMFHNETDIDIYGYFSLDAALFFNIIGSVVTYLVILVQFDG